MMINRTDAVAPAVSITKRRPTSARGRGGGLVATVSDLCDAGSQ
jgi:hypothetical protein